MTAHIPQNDIRTIWSDVWLRTANEWGSYPLQKQLDLIHEDHHIYDLSQQIEKEREEFRRIMDRALNNPIDRFIDNFMIPVTVFAAQQSPYGRAAMAFATTARAVAPKLGQIATSIGATAAFQRYSTFLSQKASSGDPKPRADRDFKSGEYWDKLITDKKSATSSGLRGKQADEVSGDLVRLKRLVGGEVRADSAGNFYKFDRAHQSAKVHLEKIVKRSDGFYNVAEVDPVTGKVIRALKDPRKL